MSSDFIVTRGARSKTNLCENFKSVEYVTYKKKVSASKDKETNVDKFEKKREDEKEDEEVDPKKQQELAMKKARHEVIKFGMSGLHNLEAKKAKIASAVALGARPPKNRKTNYKKLKEIKQRSKERVVKQERASGVDGSLVKRKTRKKRVARDSGILGIYGKVQKTTVGKR